MLSFHSHVSSKAQIVSQTKLTLSFAAIICWALITAAPVVQASEVRVDVTLSPAGSFVAKTEKVQGEAMRSADGGVIAKNIIVDVPSLKTSIGLRDKHLHEKLQAPKYPTVKLIEANGKGGKGEATIEVMGKTQKVKGTYKVDGDTLKAQFPLKISDVGLDEISYMAISVEDEVVIHVELPLKAGGENSTGEGAKRQKASYEGESSRGQRRKK